tara:strand:- start:6947 stop:9280 length:2334 start_codon:yes stop_codon:yes gene_type:complete
MAKRKTVKKSTHTSTSGDGTSPGKASSVQQEKTFHDEACSTYILPLNDFRDSSDVFHSRIGQRILTSLRGMESEPLIYPEITAHEDVKVTLLQKGFKGLNGFPFLINETVDRENQDDKTRHDALAQNLFHGFPREDGTRSLSEFVISITSDPSSHIECRTLLILGPKTEGASQRVSTTERLRHLLTNAGRGPVVQCLIQLQRWAELADDERQREINMQAKSGILTASLEWSLAIAQFVRDRGGSSLLLWQDRGQVAEQDVTGDPASDNAHDPVRYFTFHIATYRELSEKLLGAITLRRKAGFQFGERRGARDRSGPTPAWNHWGVQPDSEVRQLMRLEFENKENYAIFDGLCRELSSEAVENNETTRFHRVMLSAVRLCKRLANRTLEGTPFDFTVFIPAAAYLPDGSQVRDEDTRVHRDRWIDECCEATSLYREPKEEQNGTPPDLNPVASLLDEFIHNGEGGNPVSEGSRTKCRPSSWTPFTFDFEDSAGNLAELSQSPQLALLLDPETGLLTHLLQKESVFNLDGLLFAQLESFFSRNGPHHRGVFLQGSQGKVEIHAKLRSSLKNEDRFVLTFDGFRWLPRPRENLRCHLQKILVGNVAEIKQPSVIGEEQAREALTQRSQSMPVSRRVEQAITILLRDQKSSLLLFLHDDDAENFDKHLLHSGGGGAGGDLQVEPMRANVRIIRALEQLNPLPLAGLLQTDGLHVIRKRANSHFLTHFAQRVSGIQNSSSPTSSPVGSGSSIAKLLADKFRGSTVIKVSASGSFKIERKKRT